MRSRLSTVALIVLALLTACGGGSSESPKPTAAPSAVAAPVPEYGLSATEYSQDPVALAKEFYRIRNELMIAGIDQSVRDDERRLEVTDREWVVQVVQPMHDAFVEAMFVESWANDPDLAEYVNSILEIALDTKEVRLKTDPDKPQNIEPYERRLDLERVEGTVDPLETSVRWVDSDNRGQNEGEEFYSGVSGFDGTSDGGETLTWINVDGQLKISGVRHFDG